MGLLLAMVGRDKYIDNADVLFCYCCLNKCVVIGYQIGDNALYHRLRLIQAGCSQCHPVDQKRPGNNYSYFRLVQVSVKYDSQPEFEDDLASKMRQSRIFQHGLQFGFQLQCRTVWKIALGWFYCFKWLMLLIPQILQFCGWNKQIALLFIDRRVENGIYKFY